MQNIFVVVVVANKIDIEGRTSVKREEAEVYARELEAQYFEVSAVLYSFIRSSKGPT